MSDTENTMVGMDASDMEVPRLTIVQPTSSSLLAEGATPGQLWDTMSGAGYDSVRVVPISITKGRVYFEGGEVACRSDNAMVPAPWVNSPVSEMCTTCSLAEWNDRKPPSCQLCYQMLLYRVDYGMPCQFTAKGAGIRPSKRLITAIAMRRVPPWRVEAVLSSVRQTNSRGTFYTPQWSAIRPVDPEGQYEDVALGLLAAGGKSTESITDGNSDLPF